MDNQAPFKFACPHCGQHLEAEPDMVGMELECPSCGKAITVPEPNVTMQTDNENVDETEQIKSKGLLLSVKKSCVFAWHKALWPTICFCSSSVWFVLRNACLGVRIAVSFSTRHIRGMLNHSHGTNEENSVTAITGTPSRLRQFRGILFRFIVSPVKWIWDHTATPLDAYYTKNHGEISQRRRFAYGFVGISTLIVCCVIIRSSLPSTKDYTANLHRASDGFLNSWFKAHGLDTTGWSQERIDSFRSAAVRMEYERIERNLKALSEREQARMYYQGSQYVDPWNQAVRRGAQKAMAEYQQKQSPVQRQLDEQQRQIQQLQQQQRQQQQQRLKQCGQCNGTGYLGGRKCGLCNGTGILMTNSRW